MKQGLQGRLGDALLFCKNFLILTLAVYTRQEMPSCLVLPCWTCPTLFRRCVLCSTRQKSACTPEHVAQMQLKTWLLSHGLPSAKQSLLPPMPRQQRMQCSDMHASQAWHMSALAQSKRHHGREKLDVDYVHGLVKVMEAGARNAPSPARPMLEPTEGAVHCLMPTESARGEDCWLAGTRG